MMLFTITIFLVVALVLLLYAGMSLISVLGGAQLVTTPRVVWALIVELAALKSNDRFVELGSGLGYVSGFVARSTNASVLGIDLTPLWVWVARLIQQRSGASFYVGNIYLADLTSTDVIYCYLLPPMLAKLEPKFDTELKPGGRVITYGFPLPNRRSVQTIRRTPQHGPLFLYRF